ncbi:MAG TPA: plastocyanin/azurin family copper-binding protein [Gaiellaceae bacterium]|nr:plastocyanin/azurin family copper-binding protein [Gaiellaceae bacterium]
MRHRTAAVLVLAGASLALAAAPAPGQTRTLRATVGPGFTITLTPKPTKPGRYTLVVSDRSPIHNFHLRGPGVNVKTSVPGQGRKTFTITLRKGLYTYVCDPHAASMRGSFRIR